MQSIRGANSAYVCVIKILSGFLVWGTVEPRMHKNRCTCTSVNWELLFKQKCW